MACFNEGTVASVTVTTCPLFEQTGVQIQWTVNIKHYDWMYILSWEKKENIDDTDDAQAGKEIN